MKIQVTTLFDCTRTGVVGRFREGKTPFVDEAGQDVTDELSWNRSRNQQRNFETLLQTIGLRTQIDDVTVPETQQGRWIFTLIPERPHALGTDLHDLMQDCVDVPMIVGLGESRAVADRLIP